MTIVVRTVPWLNREEYFEVYNWFYPKDSESLTKWEVIKLNELAVKRVRAWAQQCRLPCHVDATLSLMEAYIHDQSISQAQTNEFELRLMYSMAIIRFVNLTIDPVSSATKLKSMTHTASRMEFPLHIIQLRHKATHQNLPSLKVLRDCLVEGLEWLDRHCWSVVDSQESYDKEDLKTWLSSYKQVSKSSIKDNDESSTSNWLASNQLDIDLNLLVPILLEEGYLVPLRKKKRPCPKRLTLEGDHLKVWSPLIFHLGKSDANFLYYLSSGIITKLHHHKPNMTSHLQSHLLNRGLMSENGTDPKLLDDSYYTTLTAWLIQMLNWNHRGMGIFLKRFSVDEVAYSCLNSPNLYHTKVLENIYLRYGEVLPGFFAQVQLAKEMNHYPEVSKVYQADCLEDSKSLLDRCEEYLATHPIDETPPFDHPPDHLPHDAPLSPTPSSTSTPHPPTTSDPQIWSKLTPSHWHPCPLGLTSPSSTQFPDLSLPLDWDQLPPYLPAYLNPSDQ